MRRAFLYVPVFSSLFLLKNYFKLSNFCCFIAVRGEGETCVGLSKTFTRMKISISPSALEQNPKSSRKRGHKFSQEAALTGIYNEERISSAPDNTNCRNSSSEQNDDNFASHRSEKGGGGRQGRKSAFIFVIFHPQQFIFSVSQDFSLHGISEGKKEKKTFVRWLHPLPIWVFFCLHGVRRRGRNPVFLARSTKMLGLKIFTWSSKKR